jgi:hypothetical protein
MARLLLLALLAAAAPVAMAMAVEVDHSISGEVFYTRVCQENKRAKSTAGRHEISCWGPWGFFPLSRAPR